MRKRFVLLFVAALGVLGAGTFAAPARADVRPCANGNLFCTETVDPLGEYTGHDEPSLLFYSNTPGSGSSQIYIMLADGSELRLVTTQGTNTSPSWSGYFR